MQDIHPLTPRAELLKELEDKKTGIKIEIVEKTRYTLKGTLQNITILDNECLICQTR